MKRLVLFLSLVFLIQSCKSSYSKTELLKENKALKERIKKLETADTVNQEAAFELKKMNVVYRGVANNKYPANSKIARPKPFIESKPAAIASIFC